MKILIASDTYFPTVNGAAYFTYRLSTELAKRGHQVSVIAPSREVSNTVTKLEGVTVYGVRSLPIMFYKDFRVSPIFMISGEIKKIIQKINPDVIHVQNHINIGRTVADLGAELNIPLVGTNHFMPENLIHYFHLPKTAERHVMQLAWNDFSKVYGKLDYVTSPTQTAADLLKKVGFKKDVKAVSCGIDLKRFNPKNDGQYLKERYGLPKGVPILAYIGRLDKDKNVDTIIKSLPKILKVKKVHLVIGGVGVLRNKLESLVSDLNLESHVTFAGFVPDKDLGSYYRMADIFVTTGGAELQCLSALEAAASGLPIVAAGEVAVPELVHDGENGFLFPLNNSSKLADGVIKILKSKKLADKMSKESLKIAKTHDIQRSISIFEDIYKEVVETKKFAMVLEKHFPTEFYLKTVFVLIIVGILFRISLSSPSMVEANGVAIKNKILNSELVKKLEKIDLKSKVNTFRN